MALLRGDAAAAGRRGQLLVREQRRGRQLRGGLHPARHQPRVRQRQLPLGPHRGPGAGAGQHRVGGGGGVRPGGGVRSGGGAAVGEDGDGEDDRLGHGDLVVLLAHVLHDGLALGVEPRVLHKAENGSD